jgi:hypothetical protein
LIIVPEVLGRQVLGPDRGPIEPEVSTAFEYAVDDRVGEIVVVQDVSPALGVLVGGEHHRASANVSIIDHVVEDVGRVGAVGEVADLVDDEHVRPHVGRECLAHLAIAACGGEVLDQLGCGREERVEAILHRAVRDRDREVGLAATGLALEDDRAALGDEVGREERADRREAQRRLVAEVELLDRAQERERGGAHGAAEARAAAVRDLLGEERVEKLLVRPLFLLGALHEVTPSATRVGEMQSLEQRVEVGGHDAPRFDSARTPSIVSCRPSWPRGCAAAA